MDTDIMDNRTIRTNRWWRWSCSSAWCIPLVSFFCYSSGSARDWEIIPEVTATQIYTDNIYLLSSAGAKDAFVTELTPGVKISRQGVRSNFNLNYRMQNLIYEGINFGPKIYNQLQMSSVTELLEKSVFVDSTSSIGQANVSALGNITLDNISRGTNSTEYRTFRLSPYWRPHLGGYAEGEVRVGYSNVSNSGGIANTDGNNALNLDSNIYQQSLYLNNGAKFDSSGVGWRIAANNQEIQRNQTIQTQQGNLDVTFRGYHGEISYAFLDDINLFVQGGYYDNHYPVGTKEYNGFYLTPGLAWIPNPRFNIAGGYGVNTSFAHLRWEPSQRTGFQITYQDSSVGGTSSTAGGNGGTDRGYGGNVGIQSGTSSSISGLGSSIGGGFGTGSGLDSSSPASNRQVVLSSLYGPLGYGNVGPTWNGSFHHRSRNITWTASYGVSTYTSQQALTSLYTFSVDPTGGQIPNGRYIDLANLTNDLITSKRAQISFAWSIQRANINLSAYQTDITYQSTTSSPQDNVGVDASLSWKFSPQSNATLLGAYQITNFKSSALTNLNSNQRNEFKMVSLRFSRNFTSFLDGYLEARHTRQDGNNLVSGLIGSGIYDENRVSASIHLRF